MSYIGRVRVNPANGHNFPVYLGFKKTELVYHQASINITFLQGYYQGINK